jgi:hypothetical protein
LNNNGPTIYLLRGGKLGFCISHICFLVSQVFLFIKIYMRDIEERQNWNIRGKNLARQKTRHYFINPILPK